MIQCKYLENSHCKLVEELTSIPSPVTTECSNCSQDINLVTLTLASRLTPEREYDISLLGHGFGTRLSKLLSHLSLSEMSESKGRDSEDRDSTLSLSEVEGCECNVHKDILDLWTPEYIRSNIDRVVQWLADEARKRRLPFSYRITRFFLLQLLK